MLVNGLPINSGFFGNVAWNRAPKETIEHVEVVRGASSSLFGSFAMGGVVDVVTRTQFVERDFTVASPRLAARLELAKGWALRGAYFQVLPRAHARRALPQLKVYRREETPERWHYRDHPRIPPIVGVADEGWQVMTRAMREAAARRFGARVTGAHGYDPAQAPSMRWLLVAAGPAFKSGVRLPLFENVNVYPALAAILGVPAADNDGDPAVARSLSR